MCYFLISNMCVCVKVGSVTSLKVNFNFLKFQGCATYVIRGGGDVKLFSNGGGVQLLSDKTYDLFWTPVQMLSDNTYDLYWTPVSTLDLSNYREI